MALFEAGKLELNPQTVQLVPLIDEVVGTARQLANQNKNRRTHSRAYSAHAQPDDDGAGATSSRPLVIEPPIAQTLENAPI